MDGEHGAHLPTTRLLWQAAALLWLVLASVLVSTGQDPGTESGTQQTTDRPRMVKVACERKDHDRILFREATTANPIAHVSCGEEVAVLARAGATYQVRRSSGEVGFLFADAIDMSSTERAKVKPAKPSWAEKQATKVCEKNPSWKYSDCLNVAQNHVLVGMTYAMVLAAWGPPLNSTTTQLAGGHYTLQLVYNNPNGGWAGLLNNLSCNMPNSNPATCTQYKNTYVYVQDGFVTAIQN